MAKEKLTPETTDEIQATDAVEIQTEDREPVAPRTQTVVKKSGTGLSLLAILIALGDRKSTRLNSSHSDRSRMPSSA